MSKVEVEKRKQRIEPYAVWKHSGTEIWKNGYVRTEQGLVLATICGPIAEKGSTTLEFLYKGFSYWWIYDKAYSGQYAVTLAKRMAAEIAND